MALDGIKYIFQVPLSWFRRVDKRVFGDHPGPGIRFDECFDGSRAIGVDYHVLDERYGGGGAPENPQTYDDLTTAGEGTATAKTDSHAYGGTDGARMTVCTRTFYDHTSTTPVLYGFYRTLTFDKNGRLYGISAETRYIIDQPVVGNITT